MEALEIVLQRGEAAYQSGDLHEAARLYEIAVGIKPGYWYSVYCLGVVMAHLKSDGFAIPLLSQAVSLNPEKTHFETIYNLGLCMRRQGHTKSARMLYDVALANNPGHAEMPELMNAIAGTYINAGEPEKALEFAQKALEQDPTNPRAKYYCGMAFMEMGKFGEGFALYENRFFLPEWTKRAYEAPRWDGAPVETLVIHGEQGIGDEILFLSWLRRMRNYQNLVIECTPRMVKTFSRSFGVPCYGTDREVIGAGVKADAVVAMGSLPNVVGGMPPAGAYLIPDVARVEHYRRELRKLGPGPYIGVSWHGGVVKTHAHLRATDAMQWAELVKHGTVVSVQYGDRAEEAAALGIPHWSEAIADLDELCALISALDLAITVNNTTVHMAGALDVPCWTLTPSRPAWRYGLKGESMPWYRSVRQFRQEGDDWTPVFERVTRDLRAFVADRKAA